MKQNSNRVENLLDETSTLASSNADLRNNFSGLSRKLDVFSLMFDQIKSNLHYTRRITPKRVTSCGAHLRGLAPGLHSSEEASQRWRVVGDTVPI